MSLPNSVDAESALLGVLIRELKPLPDELQPSDFFEAKHQDIATAMLRCYEDVNEKTVSNTLRKMKSPVNDWFVSQMTSAAPMVEHSALWIESIVRTSKLRKLSGSLAKAVEAANDPNADIEGIIDYASSVLGAIEPPKATAKDGPQSFDFKRMVDFKKDEDPTTVLGNRYLCRGGTCLIVSQTGVGKSALVAHAAVNLALGRDFFGIKSKPGRLKSLIIQSENDEGDCSEAIIGTLENLGITKDSQEIDILAERVFYYREAIKTGEAFGQLLKTLIEKHQPDCLWIDPILGFSGVDLSDQEACSHFLRHIIQPVLGNTILFSVHHTTKPGKAADGPISLHDLAYAGAGSAELSNWHRSIMVLQKDPTPEGQDEQPFYTLRLAKRGGRAGVKDKAGNYITAIPLRHSKTAGRIAWELRDSDSSPAKGLPRRQEWR